MTVNLESPNSEMLKTQTLTTLGIPFAGIILSWIGIFGFFYFAKISFKNTF